MSTELTTPLKIEIPGIGTIESADLYLKSEADKVIAEKDAEIAKLKDKCNMHDFFWDGCGFAKRGFKNAIAVSEAYDFLEQENTQLKEAIAVYQRNEKLDIRENRRLKRALWLMTAEWAEAMGLASCNIAAKFMSRENFEVSDDYRKKTIKKYRHRQVVFYKYADYCRQKTEEFKEAK